MARAIACSNIVFPVRGAATISPRCPFPIGVVRSMTRVQYSSRSNSKLNSFFRIEGREVVEQDLVSGNLGVFEIDLFDLEQRKVPLAFLRRPDLTGDDVAQCEG